MAQIELPIDVLLQYLKAMEKDIVKENVKKYVEKDEKVKNIKFDMTVKTFVKNTSIIIKLGLLTKILVTMDDQ